jgi:NADH:ubiquinone oxidoreductase subunit 5 (subunit L)/multisubunit Na+/H+ antiporter MnhA subunit
MSLPLLLAVFAIPTISIPFVYLTGKKSPKAAAIFVALIALINIALVAYTVPTIMEIGSYTETYTWIPTVINT